ncbi:MAG: hypothetical protein U1A72_16055 [Sulfuritalea sp.]|nr:hypothetical protein [Sulfuritalea sp.]
MALMMGSAVFVFAQSRLPDIKRAQVSAEITIALPVFVQVVMAGGDRYLAASWAAIRALVTETSKMGPEDFRVLGLVQRDASWLNPAHEDNYYIAAAILPWEGQVEAAQVILRRATLARFYDYQPAFYYAFNLTHFMGDYMAASEWLLQAAPKLPKPDERLLLENFAARWLDRTQDVELAARIVDAMAAQARRKDFADYLRVRAQRLRDLGVLRRAAVVYSDRHGKPLVELSELVSAGLVAKLPVDPFGFGFGVDPNGVPVLLNRPQK